MAKINRRTFIKSSALAGAGLSLGFYDSRKIEVNQPFDTIIANGYIYTGDGKAPIRGDIGIKSGKIAAIGALGRSADRIVEANGMAVSPGFIDIHSHTDTKLFDCPFADSRIYQGITTEVGGNCGGSPFPYSEEYYQSKKDTLRKGFPFWKDIDGFYDALRSTKIAINYASLTGQGDIRDAVVGSNAVPATADQIEKMRIIMDEQMQKGSIGVSCGLEYAPGSYASDDEIIELCKVVAKHNGLFAIHMRNEDDRVEESIKEAINIAKKSGVRLQISHLKAQNAPNWHKAPNMLRIIEDAERSGVDIAFDRYPYTAFNTGLSSFVPLIDRQGSTQEIVARLKNEAKAKEIGVYADARIKRLGGGQNVMITSAYKPENKKYIGKNLEECSKISGLDIWPFIRQILIDENMSPDIVGFGMTEDNVKLFLSHRLAMPASDGSIYSPVGPLSEIMPHPRSYGTFPRFIGKYHRQEKIMDLPAAIHKCTALPASRIGIKDRGLLIPGYYADIVVFNPDTIIDKATYDNPHQFAAGIDHVFVNGNWSIRSGKPSSEMGGMVI